MEPPPAPARTAGVRDPGLQGFSPPGRPKDRRRPAAHNCYYPASGRATMGAAERDDHVIVGDGQVAVNGFTTEVREIVEYFSGLPESSPLDRKLEDALRMGVMAITATGTAQNIDHVEKEFELLKSGFDQKLESVFGERGQVAEIIARHFGEDGQVAEIIARHFGEDGKLLGELLNPNREGSPLGLLKDDLHRALGEIRDKLGAQEAARSVAAKGTQKGRDFEAWCEGVLGLAAKANGDTLVNTSYQSGSTGAGKKGDLVATLSGTANARIVFEMKDKSAVSLPEISKELRGAMENRDASYGVFVAKNKKSLPEAVGWFSEYDNGSMLACAVEDGEGNAVLDGEMLIMVYSWARARARAAAEARNEVHPKGRENEVDTDLVAEKARDIGERLEGLSKIKRECGNVKKSSEKIKGLADEVQTGIKADAGEIIELLGGP